MARKPAPKLDEKLLTKGELRKLTALRKSVGEVIGDQAFMDWLRKKPAKVVAAEDKDAALIETKMTDLNAALMKVGEKVYAQETAAGTDGSSPNGASEAEAEAESESDEAETVEGEFREV